MKPFIIGLAVALATGCGIAQTIDWHDAAAVGRAAAAASPSLRRVEAEVRAGRERITIAAAQPNPMIMAGVQDLQVDLSHDEMMTMYMVGASQTIRRPSRRQALRAAATSAALYAELQAESIRAEVERDAMLLWYDVAAADGRLQALRDIAAASEAVTAATRARYETGSAEQVEVARAQLQRSEIDHQILTENGKRRTAAVRLLALLGLPLTTDVPALQLSHGTERRTITAPPEIPDSHPALQALRNEVGRREQEILLARLSTRADIGVEASYGMRPEQKDVITLLARVELPFQRRRVNEPLLREAIALRDAAAEQIEETRRLLTADLGAAYEAHGEATRQLDFHAQVLVPQSRLAFDAARAAYEAGKVPLDSVLGTQAALLRLENDYYDFLTQHIKAITNFDAIRRGARSGAAMTSGVRASSPVPMAGTSLQMR